MYEKVRTFFHRLTNTELPHWPSLLVWFLGVLVMLGLTIQDLRPVLKNYLDEEENAAVKVVAKTDLTIEPPQLFLILGFANANGVVNDQRKTGTYISRIVKGLIENKNRTNPYGTGCRECDLLMNHSWNVLESPEVTKYLLKRNLSIVDTRQFEEIWKDVFMEKIFDDVSNFTRDRSF